MYLRILHSKNIDKKEEADESLDSSRSVEDDFFPDTSEDEEIPDMPDDQIGNRLSMAKKKACYRKKKKKLSIF